MESLRGLALWNEIRRTASHESVQGAGPFLAPIRMYINRFNTTLRRSRFRDGKSARNRIHEDTTPICAKGNSGEFGERICGR
jgi:hypothetical protein